jgi:hypothetical protein
MDVDGKLTEHRKFITEAAQKAYPTEGSFA